MINAIFVQIQENQFVEMGNQQSYQTKYSMIMKIHIVLTVSMIVILAVLLVKKFQNCELCQFPQIKVNGKSVPVCEDSIMTPLFE
ncbi:unnamed protein product [Paramecium octaurelia]|uniref:Uncharacterized protein n=1 Tax=Paramecium octaurelia TaxID=43137 RepID=A0A8S1UGY8_PAROT|nr:unnamed protein product [Paramecium octaurelia]